MNKKDWIKELKYQLGVQTEKGRGSMKDIKVIFEEYLKGSRTSEKIQNTVLFKKYSEEFDRLMKILDYIDGESKFEELKVS